MKTIVAFALLLGSSLFISCEKDDPVIENEEELITTLKYTLTSLNGEVSEGVFQDIDGDGGNAPLITNIVLKPNTAYTGKITVLNESVSPVDNITTEVEAEKEAHQFFYEYTQANLAISYNDVDANNRPVGLLTNLTTGAASTGKLTITLKHNPDKAAAGVTGGNITNAGGETDIKVEFNVEIR